MSHTLEIDASKTALVVIDLQKGIVGMQTAPHAATDVVGNATKVAKAFRNHGIPIFLVRVTPSPDKKDVLHPIADASMQRRDMPADWATIVPELGPEASDFIITKHQWGAFYGTELDLQLRRRSIDTIVLCGISTNIGVESTARFAYEYGYNQIFVEDAMASQDADDHAFAVDKIFPRMGRVRSTNEVVAAIT